MKKALLAYALLICSMTNIVHATELSDLPIGHLAVTVKNNGKINVEARCVPTQAIINAICEKVGLISKFEKEIYSYDSIYIPNLYDEYSAWFRMLRNEALLWNINGNICEVNLKCDDPISDVTIKQELLNNVICPINKNNTHNGVMGIIFVDGRIMYPPYKIDMECIDNDDKIQIIINDIVVDEYSDKYNKQQVNRNVEYYEDLCRYIYDVYYPRLRQNKIDIDKSLSEVKNYLKKDNKVKDVIHNVNRGRLEILFDDEYFGDEYYPVFPQNYDYEIGKIVPLENLKSQKEMAENKMQKIFYNINKRNIIFNYKSHCVILEREKCKETLEVYKKYSDKGIYEIECLLNEITKTRKISRPLALTYKNNELKRMIEVYINE